MDLSHVDIASLARQLRHPEGELGRQVGTVMARFNGEANAFVFECLRIQPMDRVLEIGFGPGEALAEAARLTPTGFVAGIDASETMLHMAEDRNRRAITQEHIELTLGSADALPYPDAHFDAAYSVNVLHFWPDARKELSECLRVLKPAGRALFYVTHPSAWFAGLAQTGVFIAREPEEVVRLLTEAGFQEVEVHEHAAAETKGFAVTGKKPVPTIA